MIYKALIAPVFALLLCLTATSASAYCLSSFSFGDYNTDDCCYNPTLGGNPLFTCKPTGTFTVKKGYKVWNSHTGMLTFSRPLTVLTCGNLVTNNKSSGKWVKQDHKTYKCTP